MENILESSKFNVVPSPEDRKDYRVSEEIYGSSGTEDFVVGGSLEKHPIYNQLQTSMCTSFAIGCTQEFFENDNKKMSFAYLYGNREDDEYMGEGEIIRRAIVDWARDGVCYFDDFPLLGTTEECVKGFREVPQHVKDYAKDHRCDVFYRVDHTNFDEMFDIMKEFDLSLIGGIPIFQSMAKSFTNGGYITAPDEDEESLGGHAVRFIGRHTHGGKTYLIMANSWGDKIDYEGIQFVPEDFPIWEAWLCIPYEKKDIRLRINQKHYTVNGVEEQMNTSPILKNGRTLVPLRFLMEEMGALKVDWNEETHTAKVYHGNDVLIFKENEGCFSSSVHMKEIKYETDIERQGLTVNYIDENNRMLVPIRAVFEFIGWTVGWEELTSEVTLKNF